jgi:hypothetical protein
MPKGLEAAEVLFSLVAEVFETLFQHVSEGLRCIVKVEFC